MTREKGVAAATDRILEDAGAMVTATTGVAVAGTPDRIGVVPRNAPCPCCGSRGTAIAWELKRRSGRPTRLQAWHLERWAAAGAQARVIRSAQDARDALAELRERRDT